MSNYLWLFGRCLAIVWLGWHLVASAASPSPAPDALLAVFDQVLQEVVAVRQLTPTAPIARQVRGREHIRASIEALIDDELSPAEWEAERKAMIRWGLIAPDFHLREFVMDLLTEQVAGYYDPQKRTFFVADWLPEAVQIPVMAHELVHALQDQHYNLQTNFATVKGQDDLSLARKALIEGDALAVMLTYILQPLGLSMEQLPDMQTLLQAGAEMVGEPFQVYAKAPLILRQQLVFPYVHGLAFVKVALAHGGWAGLERIYRHPPVSTEQILHPEKYFAATPDLPRHVQLAAPAASLLTAWEPIRDNVLGEFLLSVVLQQFLPETEARRSVVGWEGDRYVLFERRGGQELLLVCVTAWDTEAAAVTFFESYATLLTQKYVAWEMTSPADVAERQLQHNDTRVLLRRRGRRVSIIEGARSVDLEALRMLVQETTITPSTP